MISAFLSHIIAFNIFRIVIISIISCVFQNFETCHHKYMYIRISSEGSIIKVYIESVRSIDLTDMRIFLLKYIYFIILMYREQIMGRYEMFKRRIYRITKMTNNREGDSQRHLAGYLFQMQDIIHL